MTVTSDTISPALTFIVPVRHHGNAKNWDVVVGRLLQTARSIVMQTSGDWKAIVVANRDSRIPALPEKIEIERVDFPPNPNYDLDKSNRERAYDAVRLDKGRRILSGMLRAGRSGYFMVVDDDDFISRNITRHVVANYGANGWTISDGYVWTEGGNYLFRHPRFSGLCGTSHIVRSDLYDIPESLDAADETYIKDALGSNIRIEGMLAERGVALESLPFPGAVYRVGHAGAHSKSTSIFRSYLFNRRTMGSPLGFARNVGRFRRLSTPIADEFGMDFAASPGNG